MSEYDDLVKKRHERMLTMTEQAFEKHQIQDRGDGRFRIMRPHSDGGWDSIYWSEIFIGYGGALYVGGDIDTVTFAYGPKDSMARLRWIGSHTSIGYIAQKAAIGGGRENVRVFDADIAAAEVRSWVRDWFEAHEKVYDPDHPMVVEVEDALQWCSGEGSDLLRSRIDDATNGFDPNFLDDRYDVGMVVAPAVYSAWGAVRRLVQLLEEQAKLPLEGRA